MIRNRFNRTTPWFVVCAFIFSLSSVRSTPELTLDDLRKLEIICFNHFTLFALTTLPRLVPPPVSCLQRKLLR